MVKGEICESNVTQLGNFVVVSLTWIFNSDEKASWFYDQMKPYLDQLHPGVDPFVIFPLTLEETEKDV